MNVTAKADLRIKMSRSMLKIYKFFLVGSSAGRLKPCDSHSETEISFPFP